MKKTCETCTFNRAAIGADKVVRNYCFLNPPMVMPFQSPSGKPVFVNVNRPVIEPTVDICKEHLADSLIKPH